MKGKAVVIEEDVYECTNGIGRVMNDVEVNGRDNRVLNEL